MEQMGVRPGGAAESGLGAAAAHLHRPTQPKPRMGCSRPGASVQTSGSNKRVQKQGVFYTQNFPCDVFPQLRFVEAAQIKFGTKKNTYHKDTAQALPV